MFVLILTGLCIVGAISYYLSRKEGSDTSRVGAFLDDAWRVFLAILFGIVMVLVLTCVIVILLLMWVF